MPTWSRAVTWNKILRSFTQTTYVPIYRMELVTAVSKRINTNGWKRQLTGTCVRVTSEMFLSVSFLFSSSFLSMPTIPTALILPGWKTKVENKTYKIGRTQSFVTHHIMFSMAGKDPQKKPKKNSTQLDLVSFQNICQFLAIHNNLQIIIKKHSTYNKWHI